MRAVLGAAQPSEPGIDLQAPDPEIQVPPGRIVMLLVLPIPRQVRALRALKATTTQRDPDHPHTGRAQQTRECGRDAQGRNLPARGRRTPASLRSNSCASPKPPGRTPQATKKARSDRETRAGQSPQLTYDHPRSVAFVGAKADRQINPRPGGSTVPGICACLIILPLFRLREDPRLTLPTWPWPGGTRSGPASGMPTSEGTVQFGGEALAVAEVAVAVAGSRRNR
jgi:hypothetical protein